MANENVIQTRISLKYDTYTNWQTKNPVLLKGELAIATLATDLAQEVNSATKQPILFKVGDGTSQFNALPWASALAADVYSWAKKTEAEFIEWVRTLVPVEVIDNGTGKFVTDVTVTQTNGKHVITIARADVAWGDVTGKPANIVNTVKTTNDDVVVLTPTTASSGDVTIDGKHKKYNKAGSIAEGDSNTNAAGTTATIKVPKITVDEYGHTTYDGTTTHTITIPDEVAVGDGNLTTEGDSHITVTGSFNANQDTDSKITVTHNASGVIAGQYGADANVTVGAGDSATINVPSVTVDAKGHVTAATDRVLSISIPEIPTNHVTVDTEQEITGEKTFTKDITVTTVGSNGEYGFEGTVIQEDNIEIYQARGYDGECNATNVGLGFVKVETENKKYATFSPEGFDTSYGVFRFPLNTDPDTGDDDGTTIATLNDVRQIAAGAVDYLGTVGAASGLSTEAGRGDFYRVVTQFTVGDNTAHVGDLVVAEKDNPEAKLDGANWTVIHGHEGQIVKVTGEGGLAGSGTSGEVKLSIADSGVTTAKINNGAVTEAKLDTTLANKVNNKKDKQTAVADPTASGKALAFIDTISQNANGEITVTKKNVNLDAYATTQSVTEAINALDVTDISGMGAGKTIKTLTETDGKIAATFQDISITASQVSDFSTKVAAVKVANATNADNATKATQDASGNVITTTYATKTELTNAVNALDSSVTATAATNDEYSVLTGVTQTDGKLTAKTEVKLAKVAKTGSIYDVAEGSNTTSAGVKYLIFDCGSATEVI